MKTRVEILREQLQSLYKEAGKSPFEETIIDMLDSIIDELESLGGKGNA